MNAEYTLGRTVYTLDRLLADPNPRLPIVVEVAQGFLGSDEMDAVSLGEMYFIHRVIRSEPEVGKGLRYFVANAICSGSMKIIEESILIPTWAKMQVRLVVASQTRGTGSWKNFLQQCHLVATRGKTAWLRDRGVTYKVTLPPKAKHWKPTGNLTLRDSIEPVEHLYTVLTTSRRIPNYSKPQAVSPRQGRAGVVHQRARSPGPFLTRDPPAIGVARPLRKAMTRSPIASAMDISWPPSSSDTDSSEAGYVYMKSEPPRNTSVKERGQGQMPHFEAELLPPSKQFEDLRQVPQNLASLSAAEVGHVLNLLGMGRYTEQFLADHVDGSLLVCMTERMLTYRFRFDDFEAVKLMKFIQGWRAT